MKRVQHPEVSGLIHKWMINGEQHLACAELDSVLPLKNRTQTDEKTTSKKTILGNHSICVDFDFI